MLTLPNFSAGAGNLNISVTVDSNGAVFESNPANNTATANVVSTLANYPILAVSAVQAPASAAPGAGVPVIYMVTNNGNAAAAGPWIDEIFAGPNADGSSATPLGTLEYDGTIAPGQSVARTRR